MPLSKRDRIALHHLVDKGEAVIVRKPISEEEFVSFYEHMMERKVRVSDNDWNEFKWDWLSKTTYAPARREWKTRLSEGTWIVGYDRKINTFLSSSQTPHKDNIDLDDWLQSVLNPAGYLQSKFPRNAADLAVAALEGNENPMDMDTKDMGDSPADLDLPDMGAQILSEFP